MPNQEDVEPQLQRNLLAAASMTEELSVRLADRYGADELVSDEPMNRGVHDPQLGRAWDKTRYIEQVRARLAFLLTINIPLLDFPPWAGHRGYAARGDGSGWLIRCCCSHSIGGR